MRRCIIELALAIFIVVVSANYLRLYDTGAWFDPIRAVEIAEVASLYFFATLGGSYTIWRVHKQWRYCIYGE